MDIKVISKSETTEVRTYDGVEVSMDITDVPEGIAKERKFIELYRTIKGDNIKLPKSKTKKQIAVEASNIENKLITIESLTGVLVGTIGGVIGYFVFYIDTIGNILTAVLLSFLFNTIVTALYAVSRIEVVNGKIVFKWVNAVYHLIGVVFINLIMGLTDWIVDFIH
jgi:hypothetical protein